MTDKVQKIREAVEKLKSNLVYGACSSQTAMETRCKEEAYNEVLSILDTMKEEPVELKEVDLNIEEELKKYGINSPKTRDVCIASHFFELGLLSTITEEDCKLIWNIGDDLPYMPEEDFFKELLQRFKAQKRE